MPPQEINLKALHHPNELYDHTIEWLNLVI